jgi:hypothetical protein
MKMVRRSRKPRFGDVQVPEIRLHHKLARGQNPKPVKTPGPHGSRKPGMRKK